MSRRHILPPTGAEKKKMYPLPLTRLPKQPPPKGPDVPQTDLPCAHPPSMHSIAFARAEGSVYPYWTAINTSRRFRPHFAARWKQRRGALFLYWQMYAFEARRREQANPEKFRWRRRVLKVVNFSQDHTYSSRDGDRYIAGAIIPPGNAIVTSPLNATGGIDRAGLEKLEDTEFVWPYLDQLCPFQPMFTELMVGRQWERSYKERFLNDEPPPALGTGTTVPPTFALLYAKYLRALGRAGAGTRLGKWLDVWLERAEKEAKRLDELQS